MNASPEATMPPRYVPIPPAVFYRTGRLSTLWVKEGAPMFATFRNPFGQEHYKAVALLDESELALLARYNVGRARHYLGRLECTSKRRDARLAAEAMALARLYVARLVRRWGRDPVDDDYPFPVRDDGAGNPWLFVDSQWRLPVRAARRERSRADHRRAAVRRPGQPDRRVL